MRKKSHAEKNEVAVRNIKEHCGLPVDFQPGHNHKHQNKQRLQRLADFLKVPADFGGAGK